LDKQLKLRHMTKKSKIQACFFLILLALLISCRSVDKHKTVTLVGLQDLLKQNGYEPVQVPRDFDGVKSIISFKNGVEIVVSPPRQCLSGLQIGGGTAQFPLTDTQSLRQLKATAGSEYLKAKKINVDLAFDRNRVQNVIVHIDSTKIEKIYPDELKDFVERNPLSGTCSERFKSDSVYAIIYETVIATRLTYSFIRNDSTKLNISADFLNLLGLNTNDVVTNNEKTTLTIKQPLIIGYKAMKIKDFIGSFTGLLRIGSLEELSLADIEKLKKQ
jgi:hypothetical protein